jgi:hypothetical protein
MGTDTTDQIARVAIVPGRMDLLQPPSPVVGLPLWRSLLRALEVTSCDFAPVSKIRPFGAGFLAAI